MVQLPNFAIGKIPLNHNRASSMIYTCYDTGVAAISSTLYCIKDFELWFISQKDFIPLLYCLIFDQLGHCSHLTLFCFLSSGFLTAILPYTPASQSLLLTVDVDNIFSWHWFSCAKMFWAVSHLSCKLIALIVFSISKTGRMQQAVIQHNIV